MSTLPVGRKRSTSIRLDPVRLNTHHASPIAPPTAPPTLHSCHRVTPVFSVLPTALVVRHSSAVPPLLPCATQPSSDKPTRKLRIPTVCLPVKLGDSSVWVDPNAIHLPSGYGHTLGQPGPIAETKPLAIHPSGFRKPALVFYHTAPRAKLLGHWEGTVPWI